MTVYRGGGTKDASREEEKSRTTEKTDGGDAEGERRGRVLTHIPVSTHLSIKATTPLTSLSLF